MAISDRLILFARYPVPGATKTRLIPALGAEGAAELYRHMAEHTLAQARKFQSANAVRLEVWFVGGDFAQMQSWLGKDLSYQEQATGGLGDRLIQATQAAFDAGSTRVVIIGTDCPDLDSILLQKAFDQLRQQDLVLGAAMDGGYYLVGLRQFIPEIFQGIAWSTAQVLQQTVEIAERLGLAIAYLPLLSDVDYPKDLAIWERVNGRGKEGGQPT